MSDVTAETILDGAMNPSAVTVDGMTVTRGSTKDQLEALGVSEANRLATKKRRGLLMARIIPGSAVGQSRRVD